MPEREETAEFRPISVRPALAARLVGLSERTVRSMVASGELPTVKVGTARLIPWRALEERFGSTQVRDARTD